MGRYDVSNWWLSRAKKVLALQGAQTLSKSWTRHPEQYPKYIDRGEGSKVWDVDGRCYTDFASALGPILLGYNPPAVVWAVTEQAQRGPLFSMENTLSVEVAELLVDMIPGAEKVRFTKTGSTAVEAALRLARTYTGREMVIVAKDSYHGMDCNLQAVFGSGGVPKCLQSRIRTFEYNNLDSLEEAIATSPEPSAAVILEPMRTFIATQEFMDGARVLCSKYGTLLIYDEIVTFGRARGLTAAAQYGVTPDLICLGKAMASGYPLAAVCGPAKIMDAFERCFISGTYHGEAVSLAAAKATLQILRDEPVPEHIWRQGDALMKGFVEAMNNHNIPAEAEGIPPCWRQTFTGPRAQELKMAFMSGCAERGVLPGLITYPSYSHSDEDVLQTVQVYHEVAAELAKLLENPPGVGA